MTITLPRITVLRVRVTNSSLVLKSTPCHLNKHPPDFLTFSVSVGEKAFLQLLFDARNEDPRDGQKEKSFTHTKYPCYETSGAFLHTRGKNLTPGHEQVSHSPGYGNYLEKKKAKKHHKANCSSCRFGLTRGQGTLWIPHRVFEAPPNLQGSPCHNWGTSWQDFMSTEQGSHLAWDFRFETGCWLMGLN